MAVDFVIQAEPREQQGKGASRRLRRSGKIPAVLYGAGKEPMAIALDHQRILHSLQQESFYSQILTIELNGEQQRVVLRDLQRHPNATLLAREERPRSERRAASVALEGVARGVYDGDAVGWLDRHGEGGCHGLARGREFGGKDRRELVRSVEVVVVAGAGVGQRRHQVLVEIRADSDCRESEFAGGCTRRLGTQPGK